MAKKEPSLGKIMKELRSRTNMTHEQVKEKTGYSLSTISELENDKGFPKYYTVLDIVECYGNYVDFPKMKPVYEAAAAKPALNGKCLPCEGFVIKRLRY